MALALNNLQGLYAIKQRNQINNVVVLMVASCPVISKSSTPFINL